MKDRLAFQTCEHLNVAPAYPLGDARAKRLGAGFLGREPARVEEGFVSASRSKRLLAIGADPVAEPISLAIERPGDPLYLA